MMKGQYTEGEFTGYGNNGGDILEITATEDGRIMLEVGHCCVKVVKAIVPIEFVTAVLARAVIEAGGIDSALDQIEWPQPLIDKLKSQIEKI